MSSAKVSSQKIKQWKQENPDNIDKVPIQPRHLDRHIILGAVISLKRRPEQPRHQTKADDHMKGVEAGHYEIDPVKNSHLVAKLVGIDLAV